ncbi:MAG: spore maturation protein [Alphaproteobacteria bacterium]|nr:spore maturation protein [Alphaproteobacteria bacterium]
MLNFIWCGFFIVAFIVAGWRSLIEGEINVWTALINAVFADAKSAFHISLNLTGILCFWIGLLKIAENSGLAALLSKGLRPLFRKIMPEVPDNSPAMSSMIMNIAANILGLDNAATPMGLKAMEQLQELNPHKDKASNAQVLFMVINASSVTLLPITILMYRSELGASNPSAVFIPILCATSISTLAGFLSVAFVQRLNIFNRVVLSYLLGAAAFISGLAWSFSHLTPTQRLSLSADIGNFILFSVVFFFIVYGLIKKINTYESFIDGAKEGFSIAVKIIPYLVAMLVAIGVFRTSGALGYVVSGIEKFFAWSGLNTDFVAALPTAVMKPLSGSGARAMMIETMQAYGADSFPAFVSAVIQGSTETTFYVLAVYFGVVRISKVGAALPCALFADLCGIVAAIYFSYLFY